MHPNQNYQQPNQTPNQPQSGPAQSPGNPWDFLYSQPEPPKKESFFKRYKKLVIISVCALGFLVAVGVIASLSSQSTGTDDGTLQSSLEIPETEIPMKTYDGEYLSVNYADSLVINIDEALGEPEGWFLHFAEDPEDFTYDIAIQAGTEQPAYENGTDAIEAFLAETNNTPQNVVTSGVVLAGADTTKTVGEYTGEAGEERYVVYSAVEINGKHVIVNGTYPKNNQDIVQSFDSMIGSISLK